jgi:hypothetical protein
MATLNIATLELARQNPDVAFHLASPGHCRTDFNNNQGTKDPLDGAKVIVDLVLEERGRECRLWEIEGDDTEPAQIPWENVMIVILMRRKVNSRWKAMMLLDLFVSVATITFRVFDITLGDSGPRESYLRLYNRMSHVSLFFL